MIVSLLGRLATALHLLSVAIDVTSERVRWLACELFARGWRRRP